MQRVFCGFTAEAQSTVGARHAVPLHLFPSAPSRPQPSRQEIPPWSKSPATRRAVFVIHFRGSCSLDHEHDRELQPPPRAHHSLEPLKNPTAQDPEDAEGNGAT